MTKIITAGIYVRVSTSEQAEQGYSIQTQIRACKDKAYELGAIDILEYADEGFSGAKLDRPAMAKLRDDIRKDKLDIIICYDPDRLARNLAHQLLITDEIEKYCREGLIFVSVSFENSPEGRLFYSMRGAFSAYEREKILERIIRGKKGKLLAGRLGNNHLYGYDFDKDTQMYVINENEAKIIRQIFEWYISGISSEQITDKLNANNIPKIWQGKRYKWSGSTVRTILKNEKYTGIFHGWQYLQVINKCGGYSIKKKDKSQWIDIEIPAIISNEIFEKAQKQIIKNRTYNTRKEKEVHLLTGLAYCGSCGNKIYNHHNIRRKYYVCSILYDKRITDKKICKPKFLHIPEVDELVWNALTKICSSPKLIKEYMTDINNHENTFLNYKEKLCMLDKKLTKLKNSQNDILEWFSDGLIDKETAQKKLENNKQKIEQLNSNKKELLINISNLKEKHTPEDIYNIFKKSAKISIDDKRNILRSILDKIYLTKLDKSKECKSKLSLKIVFVFK